MIFKRGMKPGTMICKPYFEIDSMAVAADTNPFLGGKDGMKQRKARKEKRQKEKRDKPEKAENRLDKLENKPDWLWWQSIASAGIATIWGTSIVTGALIGGITFGGLYILRKLIRKNTDSKINQLRGNVPSGQTSAKKRKQWIRWVMRKHWPAVIAMLVAVVPVVLGIIRDASRGVEMPSGWQILVMMAGTYIIIVLPLIGLKYFLIALSSRLS